MNLKKLIKVPSRQPSQPHVSHLGLDGVVGCGLGVWLNACDAFIENDIRLGHQAASLAARRKENAIKATPKGIGQPRCIHVGVALAASQSPIETQTI